MATRRRRSGKRIRPGGRRIRCPEHGCLINSVSPKYSLPAESEGTGTSRPEQWLEAFWCPLCQQSDWYRVCKVEGSHLLTLATREIWAATTGTASPWGNPSVSQYSREHSQGTRLR